MTSKEHDDGEWEVVVDRKREKRQARKENKVAHQQALASVQDANPYASSADSANSRSAPVSDIDAIVGRLTMQNGGEGAPSALRNRSKKPKGSKKKKTENNIPQIQTKEELVKLLSDILEREPISYMHVSKLAIRVQEVTKESWNKRFKKDFGGIETFLQNNKEVFKLEEKDKVSLKSRLQQTAINEKIYEQKKEEEKKAADEKARADAAAKKKAKKTTTNKKGGQTNNNNKASTEERRGSCLSTIGAMAFCVVGGLGVTMAAVALQGGSPREITENTFVVVSEYLKEQFGL